MPLVQISDIAAETDIRRALEAGAQGVVRSDGQVGRGRPAGAGRSPVPPDGHRAIYPAVRAAGYSFRSFTEYAEWNNANIMVIPLIEHPDAIDHIDEICALPQVRILAFGAGDLDYAMGEGTQMANGPKVRAAYQKVRGAAERHDVAILGGPVLDPTTDGCRKALADGITVFCLALDILGFRRFYEDTVGALDSALEGTELSRPAAPPSGFPTR